MFAIIKLLGNFFTTITWKRQMAIAKRF